MTTSALIGLAGIAFVIWYALRDERRRIAAYKAGVTTVVVLRARERPSLAAPTEHERKAATMFLNRALAAELERGPSES